MAYSYVRIIAQDTSGSDIAGASIMEGNNCLATTGGERPLPLDPRVYNIHVEYQDRKSAERELVLEANSEPDAQREVFILDQPVSHVWIIARDTSGSDIAGASIMEGNNCLATTGGERPLSLDPRVYHIHVQYEGGRSDARELVLEANSEPDAQREVFILDQSVSQIA